jgi:rare lipoprotein A
MRTVATLALVVGLAAVVACGTRRTPPAGTEAAGLTFDQVGIASWYGRKFHGRTTASGERYDMGALTAAHRTLPFGTRVDVVRLDTGATVRVRINDRGPFVDGRIVDLSRAAARRLDMIEAGIVRVGLRVVERRALHGSRPAGSRVVRSAP